MAEPASTIEAVFGTSMPDNVSHLTPIFSSAVQVTVMGGVARISFGEAQSPTQVKFHTAIVIPTDGAEGLAKLIVDVIARNKVQTPPKSDVK